MYPGNKPKKKNIKSTQAYQQAAAAADKAIFDRMHTRINPDGTETFDVGQWDIPLQFTDLKPEGTLQLDDPNMQYVTLPNVDVIGGQQKNRKPYMITPLQGQQVDVRPGANYYIMRNGGALDWRMSFKYRK